MSDNPDDELQSTDQPSDDFSNFDPAAYVAKHNQERHFSTLNPVNEEEVRRVTRGRRRGRGVENEDEIMNDVPVGLMGRFLGLFRDGEQIHLYSEIFGEALPIAGRFLPIIGCALVFLCLFVCGGGYLL